MGGFVVACSLSLFPSSPFSLALAHTAPPLASLARMPHVNLPNSVSLYYEMHTPTCKPDPTKPSLLLLAPSWGNVLQLKDYVADFKDEYSVCTIEPRSHGRSINPVTATFDFFVAASDIAFAMEALQLPPSHIFGAGTQNFQALLKLAILFPSQVLSLSLVGLSSLYALPRHIQAFQEVGNAWHSPEDEAIWAECVEAIGQFVLTEVEGREEAWDRFLPSVVRLYNPYKARNVWMSTQPNQRVSKITPELLGEIEHPLLLIQVRTHLAPPKLRALIVTTARRARRTSASPQRTSPRWQNT